MNKENSMIMVNGGAFFKLPHEVMIDPELIYDEYRKEFRIVISYLNFDDVTNYTQAYDNIQTYMKNLNDLTNKPILYRSITIKTNNFLLTLNDPKIIYRYFDHFTTVYDIWVNDDRYIHKNMIYKGNIYESDEIRYARGNS